MPLIGEQRHNGICELIRSSDQLPELDHVAGRQARRYNLGEYRFVSDRKFHYGKKNNGI
jgi:hypothetical protein